MLQEEISQPYSSSCLGFCPLPAESDGAIELVMPAIGDLY